VAILCPGCKQTLTPGDFYRNRSRPKSMSYLVFLYELITQIGVAYYNQVWGTPWRKGRLLRTLLLGAFVVWQPPRRRPLVDSLYEPPAP
jgi:hypothetical protein